MSEQVGSRELIDDPFYFTIGETETKTGKLFTCGPFVIVCRHSDFSIILFLVGQEAPRAVSTPAARQRAHLWLDIYCDPGHQ